jgi:hypothetical protein
MTKPAWRRSTSDRADRMNRPAARALVVLALAALAGCAPGLAGPLGAPVPDPAGTAAAIAQATTPASARQAAFEWELVDHGSRLRGRGVARAAAPERLRLDLFGPRGETYLAAALVGEDFRVPAQVAEAFSLPSPALLWSALGVVRPPSGAGLTSVTSDGGLTEVRYVAGDGRTFVYRVQSGADTPRLVRLERTARRGVEESVELSYADDGGLRQARYRDWTAFRDLTLTFESFTDVESFPDAIWRP